MKPKPIQRVITEEQYNRVADAFEFGLKSFKNFFESKGQGRAEGYMISIHVVKNGRIHHDFNYQDYVLGDWGPSMIATGVQAKKAELEVQTGQSNDR